MWRSVFSNDDEFGGSPNASNGRTRTEAGTERAESGLAAVFDGRWVTNGNVPNGIRDKVELRFSGIAA